MSIQQLFYLIRGGYLLAKNAPSVYAEYKTQVEDESRVFKIVNDTLKPIPALIDKVLSKQMTYDQLLAEISSSDKSLYWRLEQNGFPSKTVEAIVANYGCLSKIMPNRASEQEYRFSLEKLKSIINQLLKTSSYNQLSRARADLQHEIVELSHTGASSATFLKKAVYTTIAVIVLTLTSRILSRDGQLNQIQWNTSQSNSTISGNVSHTPVSNPAQMVSASANLNQPIEMLTNSEVADTDSYSQFGFTITVPKSIYVPYDELKDAGIKAFVSKDGRSRIDCWSGRFDEVNNSTWQMLVDREVSNYADGIYQHDDDHWMTFRKEKDGRIEYIKSINNQRTRQYATCDLKYDTISMDKYEPIEKVLFKSLKFQ